VVRDVVTRRISEAAEVTEGAVRTGCLE